jgi:hypothetical protein
MKQLGGSTSSVERCRARADGRDLPSAPRTSHWQRNTRIAVEPKRRAPAIQSRGAAHSVCGHLRSRFERSFEGELPLLHVSAREPVGHAHDHVPRPQGSARAGRRCLGEGLRRKSSHHAAQIAIDGRASVPSQVVDERPQPSRADDASAAGWPGPRRRAHTPSGEALDFGSTGRQLRLSTDRRQIANTRTPIARHLLHASRLTGRSIRQYQSLRFGRPIPLKQVSSTPSSELTPFRLRLTARLCRWIDHPTRVLNGLAISA